MKTPASSRGVTLIEVLIALVIVSIGLLGIAKMQALAIASTRGASTRSLIAIQAASLAAAMHANRFYWSNVSTAASTFEADVSNTTITASTDGALTTQSTNCQTAVCVGVAMAAYDLASWGGAVNNVMKGSTSKVQCSGAPSTCTITVTWQENLVGMNANTQNVAQTLTNTYALLVQP
jgi:type IV pilus assembly protein PilV